MTEEFLHGIRFLPFIIKLCEKVFDYAPSFEPTIYRTLIRIIRPTIQASVPLLCACVYVCVCVLQVFTCVRACVCVCVKPDGL